MKYPQGWDHPLWIAGWERLSPLLVGNYYQSIGLGAAGQVQVLKVFFFTASTAQLADGSTGSAVCCGENRREKKKRQTSPSPRKSARNSEVRGPC